jgi:hypothetical protein
MSWRPSWGAAKLAAGDGLHLSLGCANANANGSTLRRLTTVAAVALNRLSVIYTACRGAPS